MCTVIAKESASRVVVLTGIPCCVSVEDVYRAVPKVTRENGWFEMYVGELEEAPDWVRWLDQDAKLKALKNVPVTHNGKRVWFYNIGARYDSVFPSDRRQPRVHFGRESIGRVPNRKRSR